MHIHVDVKLIQAPEGGLCDLPQGQNEADCGEGTLSSRQRPHVANAVVLSARRFHRDGESLVVVVKHHGATTVHLNQEVVEVQLAPDRQGPAHYFISVLSIEHDVLESVDELLQISHLV